MVSSFDYTYDNWSNIKSITNKNNKVRSYTYNNFGEVSSATEQYDNGTSKTYAYTYDAGGNILTENVNGTTSTYTYGNSTWKDLLTGYTTGGHTYAVTYDGAGHPLNYLGAAMTWDNAGNLASIQKGSNPFLPSATSSVSYTYLANGQRRTKTVGSQTTTYRYNNGLLLSQTTGTGTTAETLSFTYDADGKPVSITYKQGSNAAVTYFYAYNGQGDVIAIYNSSNSTLVGSYEYDLWGKLISATPASSSSDPKGILTKNPFRYRGYYYDNETGYYYLNARYYDPQVRRFISADDMANLGADGTIDAYNLFVYCGNSPLMGYDPTGAFDIGKAFKGVCRIAIGVTAIVAGATVCVAGAPLALIAIAAVTITAGALTTVNGVADIQQAATGNNFIRDTVCKGNQTAYDVYSGVTELTAVAGTIACGNYVNTNCAMRGAVLGTEGKVTLKAGTVLDRYGSPYGRYLTNPGTSMDKLALTPSNTCKLVRYVLNKPYTFRTGIVEVCEWGEGGGIQYFTWINIERLIELGVLSEMK